MAKYDSTDFDFEVDKTDGGALTSGLTAYITEFGGITVDKGTIESTPFGVSAAEFLLGVLTKYEPFTVKGFYDDGAEPAPDAVFNGTHAETRSFQLTIGGSKNVSGELWITNYKRSVEVGGYWTYEATLQPTGTITEA